MRDLKQLFDFKMNSIFRVGFTLAEGATRVATSYNSCKTGFTLAEVLITLAVIGVVASITMPMLIQNVQNKIRAERIKNIEHKLSKATDKMVSLGVMTGHNSTEDFVNELGKHLKLAKVCSNDNLKACWPYEKVIVRDSGLEWNIGGTKTPIDLKMKNNEFVDYDNTMGIITADGTSMILTYNKKCSIDDTKPISWDSAGAKSSTTGCIAAVYDWNGARKPNKYRDDVISLNSNGLGKSCAIEAGTLCISAPFFPEPVTKEECEELIDAGYGISKCYYEEDYWAGAVKKCGGVNNLPTLAQLAELASEIYLDNSGNKITISSRYEGGGKYNLNSKVAKSLGIEPAYWLWAKQEYTAKWAYGRYFGDSQTFWGNNSDGNYDRSNHSIHQAVCLE